MQTNIDQNILQTSQGVRANRILRSCVHCGFCNATCPTYQLLGDELDGPRGRIYLIKQVLEGKAVSRKTQTHLDRCLTCRNCESTCPSGVEYSQLLNIGREMVNQQVARPLTETALHFVMRKFFLSKILFPFSLSTARLFRPLLPASIKKSIPVANTYPVPAKKNCSRKILLVEGCVQPALQPGIDQAARLVFAKLNIDCITLSAGGCCGSLSHHLNAREEAIRIIKRNIDSWWPLIESKQIEAITMTASGCGVAIKEYQQLLADHAEYAAKAEAISLLYKDPVEIISQAMQQDLHKIQPAPVKQVIAYHPPCTHRHGLQLKHRVEPLLTSLGYTLKPFKDSHLCCGSAGTYSITQKALSQQLLNNKLQQIDKIKPSLIITANIGCQLHLQSGTSTPVKHWLELLV